MQIPSRQIVNRRIAGRLRWFPSSFSGQQELRSRSRPPKRRHQERAEQMSQSQYNQTLTLARAGAAYTVTAPRHYKRIIVTNESAGDVYVSTSGSAVADTEGDFGAVVHPSAWRMIGNDQPSQPRVSKTVPGRTMQNSLNPPPSGGPTHVSLMGTVANAVVEVEFV
jgi:hypothetical protein